MLLEVHEKQIWIIFAQYRYYTCHLCTYNLWISVHLWITSWHEWTWNPSLRPLSQNSLLKLPFVYFTTKSYICFTNVCMKSVHSSLCKVRKLIFQLSHKILLTCDLSCIASNDVNRTRYGIWYFSNFSTALKTYAVENHQSFKRWKKNVPTSERSPSIMASWPYRPPSSPPTDAVSY